MDNQQIEVASLLAQGVGHLPTQSMAALDGEPDLVALNAER